MRDLLAPEQLPIVHAGLRASLSEEQVAFLDLPLAGAGLNSCCAVPGSGKSTTLGNLVGCAVVDPEVSSVLVLASTVSAKNTALTKIRAAFVDSGLDDLGISFPEDRVRTFHSVALRSNNAEAGRRLDVVSAQPFVERMLDGVLEEERLAVAGASDWTSYWRAAAACSLKEKIAKEAPYASEEARGLRLFKAVTTAEEKATVSRLSGLGDDPNPLQTALKIRREITNRMLGTGSAGSTHARMLEDASAAMEHAGVLDHDTSIARFAGSEQAMLGYGGVLFVDEAQDLTACQVAIVMATLRAGARVVILGDPAQGIFRFAGANSNPMSDLADEARRAGFEVRLAQLTENFRSTRQILEASQAVLPEEDQAMRRAFSRKEGAPVVRIADQNEPKAIASKVRELIAGGRAPGDIAILRFSNFVYREGVPAALSAAGVPAAIPGRGDASHPAARALTILRVVLGQEEDESPLHLLQTAVRSIVGCQFPKWLLKHVGELADEHGRSPLETFLDADLVVARINEPEPPPDRKRQRTLFGGVAGVQESQKAEKTRQSITIFRDAWRLVNRWVHCAIEGTPLEGTLIEYDESGRARRRAPLPAPFAATSKLAELVLRIHTQLVPRSDRADELRPVLDEAEKVDELDETTVQSFAALHAERLNRSKVEDKVILSTIHSFKGCERPVVIVCGLDSSIDRTSVDNATRAAYAGLHDRPDCGAVCNCPRFRFKSKQLEREAQLERRRMLHVALSRPREELILSARGEFAPSLDGV